MDNVTHSLVGVILARTRLARTSPLAVPALVVAANLPDADVIVRPFLGTAGYLMYHRGISHSVIGIVLLLLLVTPLWWLLERRVAPAGAAAHPFGRGGPWLPLGIGLASHPLLDLLNVYGIRPWLPFDGRWYYGDLVFIVDPWGWLLLGATACLAGRRTRLGHVAWGLLALASSWVVFGLHGERTSPALCVVWPLGIVTIALLRARGGRLLAPRPVLACGLALLLGYLALLYVSRERAEEVGLTALQAHLEDGEAVLRHTPLPEPARPRTWTILAETASHLYWQGVDLPDTTSSPRRTPRNLDLAVVREAAATWRGRCWRTFARHPAAEVVEDQDGNRVLRLTDGRYWFTDWCTIEFPLASGR